MKGLPRRHRHRQRVGIGQPDVLGRHRDGATEEHHRVLPAVEHPGHPVERTLRIASAQRLVIGAEEVEVLLARLVIAREPHLHGLARHVHRHMASAADVCRCGLQHGQRPAGVAIGLGGDELQRVVVGHQFFVRKAAFTIGKRAIEQRPDVGRIQRLQHEHPRAREQRAVDFKAGVLGGGADQGDGAVFGGREQAILLGLVEAMNLVHEQHGAGTARIQPAAGEIDDLADAGHALGDRAERLEDAL